MEEKESKYGKSKIDENWNIFAIKLRFWRAERSRFSWDLNWKKIFRAKIIIPQEENSTFPKLFSKKSQYKERTSRREELDLWFCQIKPRVLSQKILQTKKPIILRLKLIKDSWLAGCLVFPASQQLSKNNQTIRIINR